MCCDKSFPKADCITCDHSGATSNTENTTGHFELSSHVENISKHRSHLVNIHSHEYCCRFSLANLREVFVLNSSNRSNPSGLKKKKKNWVRNYTVKHTHILKFPKQSKLPRLIPQTLDWISNTNTSRSETHTQK